MNGSTQNQPELKPAGSIPLKRPIRLWPAVVILLLAAGAVIWIRFFREISFQEKNLQTTSVVLIAFVLLGSIGNHRTRRGFNSLRASGRNRSEGAFLWRDSGQLARACRWRLLSWQRMLSRCKCCWRASRRLTS